MRAQYLRSVFLAVVIAGAAPGCFVEDFLDHDSPAVSQGADAGVQDERANADVRGQSEAPGPSDPERPWPSAPALRNGVAAADEALVSGVAGAA